MSGTERQALEDRLSLLFRAQGLAMEGRLQVLEGNLDRGLATLEKAASADPDDRFTRNMIARFLVDKAKGFWGVDDRQAMATYERALEMDPQNYLALYNLARYAFLAGDLQRAKVLTVRGLELAPHSPSLNYRMGLLFYNDGLPGRAERFLLTAKELDPGYAEPLMVLGDIHLDRGEAAEAAEAYQEAIRRGKDDVESRSALAAAQVSGGDLEDASANIREALDRSPGHPEALLARSRLLLAEGDRAGARRDLAEAVSAGGAGFRRRAEADPALASLLE